MELTVEDWHVLFDKVSVSTSWLPRRGAMLSVRTNVAALIGDAEVMLEVFRRHVVDGNWATDRYHAAALNCTGVAALQLRCDGEYWRVQCSLVDAANPFALAQVKTPTLRWSETNDS